MALTTYPITGNLEDALGAKATLGEVTFMPAGTTQDARVDGADAMLGPIRYSLADLPSPMPLTEGAWIITIRATGRVNGEAQFRTKTIPWNMTAATTWGAIVASAADPVPLPAPTFDESVAGVLGTGGQTDTALRETFARKDAAPISVKAHGAVGDGVADDTAAIQSAVAAARTAGGGRVLLPVGTYKVTGQIDVQGFTRPAGDTWQDRGLVIEGAGVLGTRIVSTHAGTVFRFHTGKMFCGLRNMEIHGPGKAAAGSRAVYWDGPDGNTLFENLYVHDYAVGMEWRDATLHTLVNVAVRQCAIGVRTGFNHDIHTFLGCRLDYCDTAMQIGQADAIDGTHAERDGFSQPVKFQSCRISNNTVRAAFISDRYANVHYEGCYFESNPREADIGVSGRVDGAGPMVTFTDSFFTPVTTAPVAIGIEAHNPALITVERCSTDGDGRYTLFAKLNDAKGLYRQIGASRIRAITANVQMGGRNYLDTLENREDIIVGTNAASIEHIDAGYNFPASNVWRVKGLANGTGKTWEAWRRINGATGAALSEISLHDLGGVLRLGGSSSTPGYIVATSVSALPTASVNHRGAIAFVAGGAGVADVAYWCRKNAADTYEWQALV